jgi:hypothetical protein
LAVAVLALLEVALLPAGDTQGTVPFAGQDVLTAAHWVATGFAPHWVAAAGHWVAAAGHFVAVAGHWVATAGHTVTAVSAHWVSVAGHLVAAAGHFVAAAGHFVVTAGHTVDEAFTGHCVTDAVTEHLVAVAGHLVAAPGHWVAFCGQTVTLAGQAVTVAGQVVATIRHFVTADATTVAGVGLPPLLGLVFIAISVALNASSFAWAVVRSRPKQRPAAAAAKPNHRFMLHLLTRTPNRTPLPHFEAGTELPIIYFFSNFL